MSESLISKNQNFDAHQVKLLDVTLRDGGETNNFNFSSEVVHHLISGLDKSGIEYIEVGVRNGFSATPIADSGLAGRCSKQYLDSCRKLIRSSKLTVICSAQNIKKSDFQEMRDCGVDCVRIIFFHPDPNPTLTLQTVETAKTFGFEVFLIIIHASKYPLEPLSKLVQEVARHEPHVIYLADSIGSLMPHEVTHIISHLRQNCDIDFGFHGHDSLFLAQANNLAAINCGVKYIDASLSGLGVGVGNLRLEGIVALLRTLGRMDYDVSDILSLAHYVNLNIRHEKQTLAVKSIISGIFNLSVQDVSHLDGHADLKQYYTLAEEYAETL